MVKIKTDEAVDKAVLEIDGAARESVAASDSGKVKLSSSRMIRCASGQLAGIKKNVTPHVLRHTLATNMIAHGASVIEVKEQLGHRNIETTLKYIHLQIGQRKKLYNEHCPNF